MKQLQCGDKLVPLDRPLVMGVLNVTPDSFSDGGNFVNPEAAFHHALTMINDGAAIIDIGGESTRPGAATVTADEELERVIPLVERLHAETDTLISVDTSTPAVMRAAAAAGAGLINDVRALQRDGALQAAADSGMAICLMHMQGAPANMQQQPHYDDVVAEVKHWLIKRVADCDAVGIERSRLLLDPGIGFGKNDQHNLALLNQLPALVFDELPLLVGVSRKSMIGRLLQRPVDQRLAGSLALALLSVQRGAAIMRVHDVKETVDVLKMMQWLAEG